MGSWNYVASSGSSTTEGASDVSPSHLFHLSPGTCRLVCLCLGFCGCFVCWVGFCSFLVSRVLQVLGDVLIFYPRVLDDRQCFTARSARRKKKSTFPARPFPIIFPISSTSSIQFRDFVLPSGFPRFLVLSLIPCGLWSFSLTGGTKGGGFFYWNNIHNPRPCSYVRTTL